MAHNYWKIAHPWKSNNWRVLMSMEPTDTVAGVREEHDDRAITINKLLTAGDRETIARLEAVFEESNATKDLFEQEGFGGVGVAILEFGWLDKGVWRRSMLNQVPTHVGLYIKKRNMQRYNSPTTPPTFSQGAYGFWVKELPIEIYKEAVKNSEFLLRTYNKSW